MPLFSSAKCEQTSNIEKCLTSTLLQLFLTVQVLPNVPIEVAISGTIDGDKIINVTQTIPPSPGVFQFVIPTVKEIDLNEGEFMAVLTWPSAVLDLDLAALGIAYGSCHCLHFFGGDEGPCDMGGKVVLQQDNILNSGIESLRFGYRYAVARSNNSLAGRNSRERYDIFVHNPEEVPSIARSGAIITVFYGKTSKTVNVPTSDPNSNSLFWFAGSFNVDTGVFEETPVSESFVDLRTQGDCTELIQKNYGGI
ncbi:uncharacterized protein LOC131886750 [Tigriopus californicus]|uniref:uncharacterized protein LOC131886750 n=1 Tax=Tigriopus californicus TaxID=6832 RepID=UPI0027DA487B|nr:uncharacterized protein LOC131886750 [Tigriopus californicus]